MPVFAAVNHVIAARRGVFEHQRRQVAQLQPHDGVADVVKEIEHAAKRPTPASDLQERLSKRDPLISDIARAERIAERQQAQLNGKPDGINGVPLRGDNLQTVICAARRAGRNPAGLASLTPEQLVKARAALVEFTAHGGDWAALEQFCREELPEGGSYSSRRA